MEVILLQSVERLGDLGDRVSVRPGYGRNFLIPKGKALWATVENVARVERDKVELLRRQDAILAEAKERAAALTVLALDIPVQVGAEGQLFGSVGPAEIASVAAAADVPLEKKEIRMPLGRLHTLGEHEVSVRLHPQVELSLKVKLIEAESLETS